MRRSLAMLATLALIAAACSGSGDEARATYYLEAAQLTGEYEAAAELLFDTYRTALQAATAETGDDIFVDANQGLFAGLAVDLDSTVTGLSDLVPPEDLETEHRQWLAAARALNDQIQQTSGDLTELSAAQAVDDVLKATNLVDLQDAYRSACRIVRDLATDSEAAILCEPATSS